MSELKHKNLWFAYWQDRSSCEARARLLEAWMPLVQHLLTRIAIRLPPQVERDDLLQAALIGLYGAIERFRPEMENGFEAFASHRIQGAMLDELRKNDYLSRGTRARLRKIEAAIEAGIQRDGTPPSEQELAALLGMTTDELNRTLDHARPWLSLDQPVSAEHSDDPVTLRDIVENTDSADPAAEVESADQHRLLRRAFRALAAREQKILYLYYFEELRLKEIAVLFEITEPRVCQIHTMAVLKLKSALRTFNREDEPRRAAS
jgi:RNA polymerase sigma factor for flagellar operon FliA